jgi:hypothetical protein
MDSRRFLKVTTEENNNQIIINVDRIDVVHCIKDAEHPYQVQIIDGTWYNITKEQFEELWAAV